MLTAGCSATPRTSCGFSITVAKGSCSVNCAVPREEAGQLSLTHIFLEFAGVSVELADSFAQLFDRHGVFVVHPAERLLVQVKFLGIRVSGGLHA